MPTIAVYAGHGGTDPGAVQNNLQEKNFNLALSNEVTRILRARGYEVINNRTTDVNRSITQDAQLANAENVDAVVEIHMNSSTNPTYNGTESYYSVFDQGKGKELATDITNNLAALGFTNLGANTRVNANGTDYLGIIRLTKAPAVLVETAFISNQGDLAKLNINTAAQAIANGIMEAFPITTAPPAPPVPTPPTPPVPTPPTPPAGSNAAIRGVQQTLNTRYGAGLAVDGIYGPATKRALIRGLQTELNKQYGTGLTVDGIWGPATKAATINVRQGMRGNIVYLIQAALLAKGYNITPDGIFGPQTEAKLKAFQNDNYLSVDGIAGRNTQEKLFS
ncbi:MAG: N-acetylmuramoyl-L-alanine amidase [Clostridiales bacterium]|jgi:N-acetylmuramoyl-L-alanine amidase|nr:N-acetylmuramoyl-L-alanine amidase [Clostridiales bacterium]